MKLSLIDKHEHKLQLANFDSDAIKVAQRLKKFGFDSYIVGGGVRDLLLNKRPKDFDVTTQASPKKIKSIIPHSRVIGRRFKIVHVYFPKGKYIEVTTFRDEQNEEEEEVQSLEPIFRDNKYGTEETDANRRDITINGLFYDPISEKIIDYVGGYKDLHKRTVRVIGDPDKRFIEDPIRLLRVIRHTARSGFKTEKKTWDSLKKNIQLITKASPSRLVDEFKKDLVAGALLPFFQLLSESKLAEILFPKLAFSKKDKNPEFEEALLHIDALSLSDEPPAIKTILAAVYLCGIKNNVFKSDTHSNLTKLNAILMHSKKDEFLEFFSNLTFPRKDILNAFSLVSLFYEALLFAIHDKPFNRSLLKFSYETFVELILLLKIVPMTPFDKRIINIATEGLRKSFSQYE